MKKSQLSRRNFIKKSIAGLSGGGLLFTNLDNYNKSPDLYIPKYRIDEDLKIKKYRPLGKLGFKASDVSLGTSGSSDLSLISFALDCGINYLDTAYSYGGGNSERHIGEVLKDRKRDDLWINTKFSSSAWRRNNVEQALMDSLDESLRRMGTDYVDSIMPHNGKPDMLLKDELHNMFQKAKKSGKVKYLGVSMHDEDADDVFIKTVEDGRFDIILTVYGIFSNKSTAKYFKIAYDKGIAIVAMKTLGAAYNAKIKGWKKTKIQGSGYRTKVDYTPAFMQSAFAWVLDNKYISNLVKRVYTFEELKNVVSSSGLKFGIVHKNFLKYYGSLIEGNYCEIGCGECLNSCPHKVAINKILRYKMYFENYRSEKEGILCYKELPDEQKALHCLDCKAPCSDACPNNLDVKTELIKAHELMMV